MLSELDRAQGRRGLAPASFPLISGVALALALGAEHVSIPPPSASTAAFFAASPGLTAALPLCGEASGAPGRKDSRCPSPAQTLAPGESPRQRGHWPLTPGLCPHYLLFSISLRLFCVSLPPTAAIRVLPSRFQTHPHTTVYHCLHHNFVHWLHCKKYFIMENVKQIPKEEKKEYHENNPPGTHQSASIIFSS